MLDRNGRIAVVLAAVVIAVAAFVLLSPGDDDEPTGTTAATPAATTPTPSPVEAETEEPLEEPTVAPTPETPAIEVRDGEVVGGTEEIRAKQGETVEFAVASDKPDEVHVHGYDIKKAIKSGAPARLSFKADITGIFEIELENAGLLVANLRVEP